MPDNKNGMDPSNSNINNNDYSDLSELTKKYGLSEDMPEWAKKGDIETQTPVFTAPQPVSPTRTVTPKNNTPARTPRVVYVPGSTPSMSILFDEDMPKGPEGRRVVYEAKEQESVAERRKRAAADPQLSKKGDAGFGAQPYVRHVASSQSAMKQDDPTVFSRAYAVTRHTTDNKDKQEDTGGIPISQTAGKGRLVAGNKTTGGDASEKQAKPKTVHQHYELTPGEKISAFFKSFLPWKGDPAKEVIRKIIMDISAILIVICFGYFVNNYIEHREQLKKLEELQPPVADQVEDEDSGWDDIKAKYPDIDFPEGMNIKYAELYAKNTDLVGWLRVPSTNIDTPVLHHKEDAKNNPDEDLYLRHDFYKNYNKYGNAYMDRFNSGITLDKNNIIYGHNMTDGLSFAQLEKYYNIEKYKESPVIQYSTLFNDYYFKIIAVIITNGYREGDNDYLFNYTVSYFKSTDSFNRFLEGLNERTLYFTGVDVNENDTLLTLSTCSYEIKQTDMGRLAVVARMVRPGESANVDTSKATPNPNTRYPQIWYDEHNMANPYANAYKWENN